MTRALLWMSASFSKLSFAYDASVRDTQARGCAISLCSALLSLLSFSKLSFAYDASVRDTQV